LDAAEPLDTVWRRVNHMIVAGRVEEAVAKLEEIGARTDAAYARLQLARRLSEEGGDSEPWFSEAEVFYRDVGAVHYLRQLDELRATRRTA
jgi:phage shock protein A